MAPKSLLRHIFRHGPHGKSRNTAPPPPVETNLTNKKPTSPEKNLSCYRPSRANDPPELAHTYKLRPKARPSSRASSILEHISEETSSKDTRSSYDYDASSISEALRSVLSLDVQTFSTRDLILATLNEAKSANHGHLDTIYTVLLLLEALDGFSETVAVLREEMLDKKEIYEEKMGLLQDLERAVEHISFGEEGLDMGA